MIPIDECTAILNQTKGKRNFSEKEVKAIREVLIRMAELEYLQYQIKSFTNRKKNKNESSNLCQDGN